MPLPAKRRALIAWVNCLEIGSIEQIEDIWDPNILTRLAHLVKQKADPLQDLSSLKTTADCLAFICNAVKECREFKVKLDSLVSRLVLEDEQHPDLAMEIAKFLAFLVGWFVSDCDVQKALMKLDVDIQHELLAILELFASESDCLRDELEILLLKDSTGPLVPQTPSPAPPLCPNTPKNTSTLNSNFFEYIATPMKDFFERNQAYRQHRLHRAEIDREELEMELASVREEMSKERAKLFQLEDQVERQRELLHHDQPSPSDKLVRKLESRTMSLNRMNKLCDELEEEKTFLQERVDEMTKENEVLEEKFESRMLDFETQKKELNDMVCEAKEKESEQASMMKEYEALLVEAQHQREDLQQRLEIQLSKSAAFAEKVCTCNCSGDIMSNVLQIEELKTEVSRINAENDEFSKVILEKETIIEEEKNRIDMLLGERGSLECRLSEVEDKNLELHQRVLRVTQDNEDLEIRNCIAVKKTDDLSNQISGLQDEKKQLCAKLYELEQKVDGMLQELTSLEEEKERLMYNTDGHKAEREKLSCFVSQLQEDNDKLVQELSAVSLEKEQLVEEHSMLKQNFQNLQDQMKSSSLQVTELKEEKEQAMKYTSCVEVKNAALFGQISDMQNKNDCMTMQLFETSQEMHHIQNCVGVLQQERNDLERSKEDLMGQVNCLNGTLVGLQVQVSESQSEVERLHKELLAANDSCKLLGAQVTELQRGQEEPLIKRVFLRSELKGMLNALNDKRGFEINNSKLEDQITLSNQLVEPRIEDDYVQGRSTKMLENQDLKRSYSIFLKETEDSSSQASQADDEGQELLQKRSKFEQDSERLFHDVHEVEPETQQLPVMVASHEDGQQQLELCLTKKNEVHVCGNNRQDYLDNSSCLVSELVEGAQGVIDEASLHCSENVTIPPAEGYTQTKDDASMPDETSKLQKESDLSQQPCIVEEEQQSNNCHLLRLYQENHLKNNLSSNDDETIDGVQSRVELDIEQAHLCTSLSSPPESIAEQGNVISVLKTVGTEMLQVSSLKEDLETQLARFIKEKDTNENQKLVLQEQNMEFCAKISFLMQEKQELEASNRKLGEKNENSQNLVSRLQKEQQEMIVKMSLFQEEGDGLLRDVSTLKKNNRDVLRKIDELLEEKTMCEGQISMLTIENRNLKEKLSTFNKIKNLQVVELGTQTTFHNDDPEPLPAPSEIKELQLQQLKKQVDKASECCRAKSKLAQDLTAFLGERERELMERDRELTTVREASKASEHRSKAKQHMLVETIRSLKSQLDFADKRAQQLDGAPQSNARRVTLCVPQDHMTVPLPVQTRPLALKRKLNDDCAKLFLDKTVKVKAGTYLNEVTAIKAKAAMDSSRDSLESSPSIIPSPESHARTAGDLSFELCSSENMLDEGEVQEYEFFRIAELQRRNRRCLPHMKSSYPAETQTYCKDATDEQMKTGDPTEMIQRTSLVSDSRPNDTQRTSLNIGAGPRRHTMAPTDFMQRPRAPWAAPGRQHQYCRSKPTPQSSFGGVLLGREPRSNVQHKRAADPQTLYEDEAFGINHHSIPEEASPEQICRRQSIAFKIDNTPPRQPSRRPLRPLPNRGHRPVPNRGPGSISQATNQTYDKDATVEQMRTGDSMETIQRTSLVPGSRPNHAQRTLRSVPNRGTGSISQAMNKVPRGNSSKR